MVYFIKIIDNILDSKLMGSGRGHNYDVPKRLDKLLVKNSLFPTELFDIISNTKILIYIYFNMYDYYKLIVLKLLFYLEIET